MNVALFSCISQLHAEREDITKEMRGKGVTISGERMGTNEFTCTNITNTLAKCWTINVFVYSEKKYLCFLLLHQYERSNMHKNRIFIYHCTSSSP